eukprot:gnl/TRDRNA2_/TRDRNA2_135515_c0_seq1.p1 gnl/TRDRNA2_/TRDRNA2_135515_c0~~gnl/TRDRNA2_/TRDRNA2_135515_c0_seq1.p1  ORF type:complete len:228 (-),score=35.59 gnl/TRDRNA2_/TRDRNA2_135515_c0_seq1:340-1023(-)
MAAQHIFTFALFGIIILTFVVLGLIVWAWGAFLDAHEHDPRLVRSIMFVILFCALAGEIGFTTVGFTYPWVCYVSLLTNLWGGLDAVLRFPAGHDLESFFSVKQFMLLLVKTFSYAFGINGFRSHIGKFLVLLLVNVWGLPVLYLMALPLDPAEQVASAEEDDVDLVVRVYLLASCPKERRRCLMSCRSWWHRSLDAASECSPIARYAICAASPAFRKKYQKAGRSV